MRQVLVGLCLSLACAICQAQASGVAMQLADRGPVFFSIPASGSGRVDARNAAIFKATISLDLHDIPLEQALASIQAASGLAINYRHEVVPSDLRVSLEARHITVAGALTVVLLDANLDVELTAANRAILVPRPRMPMPPTLRSQPGTGTIAGRVTDAATKESVVDVVVSVVGGSQRATTSLTGEYVLRRVPVGAQVLTFSRLGYISRRHGIEVAADSTVHADVGLDKAVQVLDQVVTTVTGDEAARSVGHVMSTLPAEQIVNSSPVTSLSDVLESRVASLQVFDGNSLVGVSPLINIRGQNSFTVSNQPLLYIDGVRVSNDPSTGLGLNGVATPGRFDDLVPEEVESIEVVKGPAASSLYGTDAANGVILVKTKRGLSGSPRWFFYGEHGVITVDPDRYPTNYMAWGTPTGGGAASQCTLLAVAAGSCTQDSLTTFTPLHDPGLTPLGTGGLDNYGLQVSGGGGTRYFVSGSYSNTTGYLHLDDFDQRTLEHAFGESSLSSSIINPNAQQKYGGRANVTAGIGSTADIAISSSFQRQDSRNVPNSVVLYGLLGPGYRDPVDNGYYFGASPGYWLVQQSATYTDHYVVSAAPTWRPWSWLTAHGSFGVDHSQTDGAQFSPGNAYSFLSSYAGDFRTSIDNYTADVGATAIAPIGVFNTRTSAGAQYFRSDNETQTVEGFNLPQGSQSVTSAASTFNAVSTSPSVVVGAYVEEQLSWQSSLYVTGGFRADGAASFGQNISTPLYPRINASWVPSSEAFWPRQNVVSSLRLRAAYGEAGVEPQYSARVPQEAYTLGAVDGQPTQGVAFSQLGNSQLEPERQHEFETGFDLDLAKSRIHLEATYYDKHSTNALYTEDVGASIGGFTETFNLGSVRNWGYEGSVTALIVDSRPLRWEIDLNGSTNHNQLVHYAPGVTNQLNTGTGAPGLTAGYPIASFFEYPIVRYAAGAGGIVGPSDVTIGKTPMFLGTSYPGIQATLGTTLSMLGHTIEVHVQVDHRGHFYETDYTESERSFFSNNQATNSRSASFATQAAAVGLLQYNTYWGYIEDASFTRLREVALTWNVSQTLGPLLRGRTLSLTLSGRNLALWTKFTGSDPETAAYGSSQVSGPYQNVAGASAVPGSYWLMRINLGL